MTFAEYATVPRRLIIARALRSLGQGMMVVNFALYLRALGWHAAAIGILLTASGLAGAGLSLLVGWTSDRYGRKAFILTYEALTVSAGLVAMLTPNAILLSAASILASFGRGQGGGAGPFGPAEQAWLAKEVPAIERGNLFSLNAAVGFVGMGLGAFLAGSVTLLGHWFTGASAFRPLFLLVILASATNLIMLSPLKDTHERRGQILELPEAERHEEARVTHQENRSMLKLSVTNALNGLAVGLTGPLIAYWFAVRYGASPAAIGSLMAISFVATGFSNLATGRVSARFGVVRSIVCIRVLGVVMLVLMPLMGTFFWASAFYFIRSLFNRGSVGARQAVSVSLTRDSRRGLASSLNNASMRFPASIGPTIAGYLMDEGNLSLPFFIGAGLQLGYALLYGRLFGHLDHELSSHEAAPST